MPTTLTTVIGNAVIPDGTWPRLGRLEFELTGWAKDDDTIYLPGQVDAAFDESGDFSINLQTSEDLPVNYDVSAVYWVQTTGRESRQRLGRISVPASEAPVLLADLLSVPAPDPTVPDALAQALAAALAAANSAAAAELAADRVDLGALDDAVVATAADRIATGLDAAATTGDRIATAADRIATGADAAATAADRIQTGADRAAAEAARDAAIAAGTWTYNVDTSADLAGLTPDLNDTALVLDTMHVWRWDGSDWIDTGESPLAVKADLIAGNMVLQSEIEDGVTAGGTPNANYYRTALLSVTAGAQYAISVMNRRVWYNSAGTAVLDTPAPGATVQTAPAGAVGLRLEGYKPSGVRPAGVYVVPQAAALVGPVPEGRRLAQAQQPLLDGALVTPGTVQPSALASFRLGKNLFNPGAATDGYFDPPNQPPQANATYAMSDFIPVEAGLLYVSNLPMRMVALYGPNRDKLWKGTNVTGSSFTPPAGVHFARISVTAASKAGFQLEQAAAPTAFEAYGYDALTVLPDGAQMRYPSSGVPPVLPRPSQWGFENLRETRQRLRSLRGGKTGLAARLTVGLIGDSWTHLTARYSLKVASALWARYHGPGAAAPIGRGYISFTHVAESYRNGSILTNNEISVVTGTWASLNGTGGGPDSGQVTGAADGELRFTAALDYGSGLEYRLYASGQAGVIAHSWDDGSTWQANTDLSVLAARLHVLTMGGKPGSGSGHLRIKVISGSPVLYGVTETHPAAAGVLVHKMGGTGTSAYQWSLVSETRFVAGWTALAPDLVTIMHGTNDQSWSQSKAGYKASIVTLVSRLRAARPACDILLIAPCENQRTNAVPMSDYADALYEVAEEYGLAFLDMQPHFGVLPADYAAGSARPWFNADGIHPEPDLGGWALADAVLMALGEQSS